MEAKQKQEEEESMPMSSNIDQLSYTPVNQETFSKWCKEWLARLEAEQAANKTEMDLRKTGKELFMEKGSIDLLTLEAEDDMVVEEEDPLAFEEEK